MIKKILFLIILLSSIVGFSQQKSITDLVATPNAFEEFTEITFESNKEQGVMLIVKNVLGKTVFQDAYYTPIGRRKIVFDKKDLASGVYIYVIQTETEVISKRFVIK